MAVSIAARGAPVFKVARNGRHGSKCLSSLLHRGLALTASRSASGDSDNDVVIVGAARTPMGSFQGSLSSFSGPALGSLAIEEALKRASCDKKDVQDVMMGCVLAAGCGQGPDRQAAIGAGIPTSVPCTMVNKICASGMKTVMLGAQSISCGHSNVVVAGGFESMSNVPYYIKRNSLTYGDAKTFDGLLHDGLTDVYNKFHMGNCGENTAKNLSISRAEQDEYGMASYRRSAAAYDAGLIQPELVEVKVKSRKGGEVVVKEDEEFRKVNFDKFLKLPTVFQREGGTITAGNASTLSDGGAAVVLMSGKEARARGLKPLAKIVGYADGAADPIDFPIAPRVANDRLLAQVGMKVSDVDLWEINEAFSVVVLANIKLSNIDPAKVNIHGGAVSLGHPLGASGCRIVIHLAHALQPGQRGVASICNGGGGASSIMLEKL